MNMHEIAEAAKNVSTYEIAAKTVRNIELNDQEKEIASYVDEWARKIGETGHDRDHEIAQYITRTVNQEFYDAPDELLDAMFDRGTIGEFDDYVADVMPVKNTLVAYDAAMEGNVPKSYLDIQALTPTWRSAQVESQISYADLRRSGWKNIALLSEFAVSALKNKMFYDIFSAVDAAIASGAENYINETTASPTQASVDKATLYLNDRGGGMFVCLSKYAQAMSKLTGYNSQEMLNEIHRTGRLGMIDGISLYPISGAHKQGNGELLIQDRRIYGIANRIGTLDMRGDVRTYETEENNKEVIDIKVTGFNYGYAFGPNSLDGMCKIVLA